MNNSISNALTFASAILSGTLFGIGMAISGMVDPNKVIGFLDVTGQWDSSLAFVMGGALIIFMPSYFLLIKPKQQSLTGEPYCIPNHQTIDRKLLIGATIFGLGWGIAGICPGPAVASLLFGNIAIVLFLVAMIVGSLLAKRYSAATSKR